MKTITKNTGKSLQKIVMLVMAGMISINLYSQKSIGNYELQKISSNLFSSTEEIMRAFAGHSSVDLFFEEELEFEGWMIDLKRWIMSIDTGSAIQNIMDAEAGAVLEEEIIFEDWMFQINWGDYIPTSDEEIELEQWMMNPFEWAKKDVDQNPVSMK